MKKIILIATLLLTACSTTPQSLIVTKLQVVTPDPRMYNCPTVDKFPAFATLTDVQVARLLTQLYKNNKTCLNSITAIQQFLDNAKKNIEK